MSALGRRLLAGVDELAWALRAAGSFANLCIRRGQPPPSAKATFGFDFQRGAGTVTGKIHYRDHTANVKINSTGVESIQVSGSTATIRGTCAVNGQNGFRFELEVTDGGSTGDMLQLSVSSGYTASGTLGGGNIVVATN